MSQSVEHHFHHLSYQLKVLESDGTAFQALFESIMSRAHPDNFQAVRTYGNQGDWKCDGRMNGQYFQCYAPDAMKEARLRAKMSADYEGCLARWKEDVRTWTLVHNGKSGLPPGACTLADQLAEKHGVAITQWNRHRLWQELDALPLHKREEILGSVPSRKDVQSVTFAELKVIVDYLARTNPDATQVGPVSTPEEKISVNHLSSYAGQLIRLGVAQTRQVQDYIDRHPDPSVGEVLKKRFSEEYGHLREEVDGDNDLLFGKMYRFASIGSENARIQGAGLAVLVHFFVTCDVFESGRIP